MTIDKQSVQAVADLKAGYTLGHADVEIIQQMALDALVQLDELEYAERRIANQQGIILSARQFISEYAVSGDAGATEFVKVIDRAAGIGKGE